MVLRTAITKPRLSAEDKKWRAEEDARTLARAEEILNDNPRLKSATDRARELAWEARVKANSLAKVANKTPRKK